LLAGVTGFAANTAQWVNVTAHVEKEIEVACVTESTPQVVTDCEYGTVFPQSRAEKLVEVTLSQSFFLQNNYSSVLYDVLWECKLYPDEAGPYGVDTTNDGIVNPNVCREELDPANEFHLDGNIRDYIDIDPSSDSCLEAGREAVYADYETDGGKAKVEYNGSGVVDTSDKKCYYHLIFDVPSCAGHVNYETDPLINTEIGDPLVDIKTVECDTTAGTGELGTDVQQWEHSADLGDTFKIQVYDWTLVID
jgi:hypothetical protein